MDELEPLTTVVSSVGTEHQAVDIGEELVDRRLATCVNIVPCRRTFYRWKGGRICDDAEYLLLIKTPRSLAGAVQETIMKLHSYELPEVMGVDSEQVEPVTHRWVVDMVQPPASDPDQS